MFFALLLVTEAMEEEERNTWEKLLIDRWERYLFSAEEADCRRQLSVTLQFYDSSEES